MRSFECLITDDRYTTRQLTWLVVSDLDRAQELARRDLLSDEHHQAIELRENGVLVFSADREALASLAVEAPAAPRPDEPRVFGRGPRRLGLGPLRREKAP